MSIFEAFAIFCGLGIHNTQMYENACKLMAKQKVSCDRNPPMQEHAEGRLYRDVEMCASQESTTMLLVGRRARSCCDGTSHTFWVRMKSLDLAIPVHFYLKVIRSGLNVSRPALQLVLRSHVLK